MDNSSISHPSEGRDNLGLGLGLRHCHADQILAGESSVSWFEVISENYLDSGGKSKYVLDQIAERYPIVCHGVSMSIGSTAPIDFGYLGKLKDLAKRVQPKWISDHLCWTGVMGINSHDLLPLPLNETTLKHVANRVSIIQDFLERPIVLENPSTYLSFKHSTLDEPAFLKQLVQETGCRLLLDVNNVFVTAYNNGADPNEYLDQFPFEYVQQMHLAGHEDCGTHIIDTHDQPVRDEVWDLYRRCWEKTGGVATCLEWDGNIPSLSECEAELYKARSYQDSEPAEPLKRKRRKSAVSSEPISTPISFILPDVMESISNEAS